MVQTLVTGATGTLGTALRPRLAAADHTVLAASRTPVEENDGDVEWVQLDLVGGTGIQSALENVDVVIHAATAPRGDTEAVDARGTTRLLEAAAEAGVENFLYPSIVGIDEIPFSYYEHKHVAETAIENSDIPSTIIRATQFHSFVAELFGYATKLPVWPLPKKIPLQPVGVGEVADVVVDYATPEASGRTDPVGGLEVLSMSELARAYCTARGIRRPILGVPVLGETAKGFRAGHATCPEHTVGTITWQEWLAERYSDGADSSNSPIRSLI